MARSAAELQRLFDEGVQGHEVVRFEVYGVNSLKTLDPPLSVLTGTVVTGFSLDSSGHLHIDCGQVVLIVDLQRTGVVERTSMNESWTLAESTARPTGRLIFSTGGSLDFKEPAKTKRIQFRLARASGL